MWRRYDDNCKTTTIQLSWALNILIYDNIDILPIPTHMKNLFLLVNTKSVVMERMISEHNWKILAGIDLGTK